MTSLAVIVSFRARALSRNWDHHCWLLEQTLSSILANDGDFCVRVVCHDQPAIPSASDPRVSFQSLGVPLPTWNNDDMCVDKVLKLSAGARWAVDQGFDYVMFADGDDLVSRRLVKFVTAHAGEPGWYSNREFYYVYGGSFIRRPPSRGRAHSSSCAIFRADLLRFDHPPFSGAWFDMVSDEAEYCAMLAGRGREVNIMAAAGHAHYVHLATAEGFTLRPLPFIATTVINHAESMSTVAGGRGAFGASPRTTLSWLKRAAKTILALRPVTPHLRREFAIPSRREVAAEFVGSNLFVR